MTLTLNGVDLNQSPDWDFSWTPYAASFSGTVADELAYADLLADVAASSVRAPGTDRYWLVKDGAGYATTVRWSRTGTNVTARLCCPRRVDFGCSDVTATYDPGGWESFEVGHWSVGAAGGTEATTPTGGVAIRITGSIPNCWGMFTFSGTWTAGRLYKVSFWYKTADFAGDQVCRLGINTSHFDPTAFTDYTSQTLDNSETAWTLHEIAWTPGTTITSDGSITTDPEVRIAFDGNDAGGLGDMYVVGTSVQECA